MKKLLLIVVLLIAGTLVYFLSGSEVTRNLDNHIYSLPYAAGSDHRVVQGYGGMFSHKYKAALDFEMAEGTGVYAARGGQVYSYKDDSNEGGPFSKYEKKANYIIIRHADGSFGCYWHLQHHGVLVKKGEVKEGQLIGYSGATGFVVRPHLHFAVKKKLNYDRDSFIRTKFNTSKGVLLPESGSSYTRP
jgi:murein DD-endopeptidase MepM/ murein hydrolase activator NlpD